MIIGVTGYAGVGKTTSLTYFPKTWKRISADAIGHSVLCEKKIKKGIIAVFGTVILEKETITRKKLRNIVLNSKKAMKTLNKIVHPILKKRIIDEIKKIKKEKRNILIDCAILGELELKKYIDHIILIDAPVSLIKKRNKKKWTEREIELIISHQKKIQKPYFIIENSGTKKELKKNITQILHKLNIIV